MAIEWGIGYILAGLYAAIRIATNEPRPPEETGIKPHDDWKDPRGGEFGRR